MPIQKNSKKKYFFSKFKNLAKNSLFCSFLDLSSIERLFRGTTNPQGPNNGHMNFSKHILYLIGGSGKKNEFQKFIFGLDRDFFLRMTTFQPTVQSCDRSCITTVVADLQRMRLPLMQKLSFVRL